MENGNLTKEQWQKIAKQMAEYLAEYPYKMVNTGIGILPIYQSKESWIEKAKKELGYETD